MVTFTTKVQVETILVSLDANVRNEIQIANIILILSRLGFKLTKESRKFVNIKDMLGSTKMNPEGTLFEIRVIRHTDAEVIMFEKRHGIKIPHMSNDYKHMKISNAGDKFLVWYKTSEKDEWTEVSDL